MKQTSLVSQKLLVRRLGPIDGDSYRLPYWEEQLVPERDFQWTGRAPGSATSPLSLSSRIRLLEDNLVSSQHSLSELPVSNRQRKTGTSQGQVWVPSELNNPLDETVSPLSWAEAKGTMRLTGVKLTSGNPPTENRASSLCQHFRLPLVRDKTGTCGRQFSHLFQEGLNCPVFRQLMLGERPQAS